MHQQRRQQRIRKLAAEIRNKQCFQEEIFGVWEDEDENQLVPIFLKTSDTMVDHDMEEVGMEDIFEESDICACNDGNRLSVVEYAEYLYANYRRMERSTKVFSSKRNGS
ncbi:hypothetical protein L1987_63405 [Smallanthus sonchifolius]|uniref:Uncharacterized protein n=1 Tax=Smallanthus sonchifolius TaxID=185202 RepID=A0ACB9CD70_9ASTR|nr:hypothetical protein L1987_63405 [Smallanthus sonchifolius]